MTKLDVLPDTGGRHKELIRLLLLLYLAVASQNFSNAQACYPLFTQSISCSDSCNEVSNISEGFQISGASDFCQHESTGCPATNQYSWQNCCRSDYSPIVVDVNGDGFKLSNLNDGITFRLDPQSLHRYKTSWTEPGSDDSWLALDRNENGEVDGAWELFGNVTPQPEPKSLWNGFRALAVYDTVAEGGNGDGKISMRDTIYSKLRLWRDLDHDGHSESSELFTLESLGITELELKYKESKKTDEFGNQFRFRAKIDDVQHTVGKWAWDVYLLFSR